MFPYLWRKLIPWQFRSTGRKPYRKPQAGAHRRKSTALHLEELESRWSPAVITNNVSGALTLDLQGDTVNVFGDSGVSSGLVFFDSNGAITVNGGSYSFTNTTTTVTFDDLTTPAFLATLTINDSSGTGTVSLGNATTALDLSDINTNLADGQTSNAASTRLLNDVTMGTGNQTYNTPVSVCSTVSLTATNVTFGSTVDDHAANADNLTVNGAVVFDGNVGVTTPLSTLNVNGNTTFNAPTFDTCSTQSYNGPVSLETGVTLNANGSIVTFDDTVDSFNSTARSLAIDGNAIFDGNVGASNQVSTLTVANTTTVNTAVMNTTGPQSYNGPVKVNSTVNFCSTGASTITFENTLDGGNDVTVTAPVGIATFCNAVGGSTPLHSLTVNTGNATIENNVTTSGNQTYEEAVNVTNTVVFNSTTGSGSTNVTFCSSLNSGNAVTVDIAAPSRAFFNSSVGNSTALKSLTINGGSDVNGNITTTGDQTYNGILDLFNTVLFNATTGGNVTFDGSLLGGNPMTVDTTTGNAVFLGTVSEDSLTVNGSNHAVLNNNVRTSNDQTYNEAVSLTGDATLTGTTVTFDGNVSGTDKSLTVNGNTNLNAGSFNTGPLGNQTYNGAVILGIDATLTGNTVTFDGNVSGSASLSVVGNTVVNASSVQTSGNQTYTGSVTLAQSSTLDATNGGTPGVHGDIHITGGVTNRAGVAGTVTLTVVDGGGATPISIGGAITDNSSFPASLTALTLTAGTLTLSGASTYTGDTTLTGGTLQLGGSTVGATGPIGTGKLILNGGALEASGAAQAISNPFTVGGGALISGTLGLTLSGDGTLNSTLTIDNHSTTTFSGALSGAGGLTTNPGGGTITLSGNTANSYTGTTLVISGTLDLDKSANTRAVAGDLNIFSGGATVTLMNNNQINNSSAAVSGTGTFDLDGFSDTIGTLTGTGMVTDNAASGGGTLTVAGTGGIFTGTIQNGAGATTSLTVNLAGGTFDLSGATLNAVDNFTLTAGTVKAPGSGNSFDVSGNFSNSGTFMAGTGTVTFTGSGTQAISGNTTFNNFANTFSAGQGLRFAQTSTTTVSGTLTLTGASTVSELALTSSVGGTAWKFDVAGSPTVSFVNVMDSDASGGTTITANNSTDSGDNTNWVLPSAPPIILSYNQGAFSDNVTPGTTVTIAGSMAFFLKRDLGLTLHASAASQFGGITAKWLQGNNNSFHNNWYYITPAGLLFAWNGSVAVTGSTQLGALDPVYYVYPDLLYSASSATFDYVLEQRLGLTFTGNFYQNSSGQNEKWLKGNINNYGNSWYYIDTTGSLYSWNGTAGTASGTLLAKLDTLYWAQPQRLYSAQPGEVTAAITNNVLTVTTVANWAGHEVVELTNTAPASHQIITLIFVNHAPLLSSIPNQTESASGPPLRITLSQSDADNDALGFSAVTGNLGFLLKQSLGLRVQGSLSINAGGQHEIWLQSTLNNWYFLKPDGTLSKWDGTAGAATGTLVATLDPVFYYHPDLITNPSAGDLAYALDQHLNLTNTGNLYLNSGGANEKWLLGKDGWYFIKPSGQLYKWDGTKGAATGTLMATLTSSYYTNIQLLSDAQPVQQVTTAVQGNTLTVTATPGLIGQTVWILVEVADSSQLVTTMFQVTVTA